MKNGITSTGILCMLLVLAVAPMLGFTLWTPSAGGVVFGGIGVVDQVEALSASITETQKRSHL
ncbi:MAG: hypothetical protein IIC60_06725 [Proteobacteria bacterium]|nr:hypothetical protein [Pseudomonadota bacterium]